MHTKRYRSLSIALLALAALTLAACGAGNDAGAGNPESNLTLEQATAPLEGAPPQLAAIRDQANQILDGGKGAFEARLGELKGIPVVVNKWASWCGPCRFEFPQFQALAAKHAGEIAFLGVDSDDATDAAETFLGELPLPFPSYSDPDSEIADFIGAPANFPSTAFYDSSGERVYVHPGVYSDEADLAADIARYAQ